MLLHKLEMLFKVHVVEQTVVVIAHIPILMYKVLTQQQTFKLQLDLTLQNQQIELVIGQ